MRNNKLAIIGGGQMGRALVGGMLASDVIDAAKIRLVEPSDESCRWWAENQSGVEVTDIATAVGDADLVLLAVKPNILPVVAKQETGFWEGKLVVSIAAGVGLDQISSWIGHHRIVRVMPNTPSLVRAGASGYPISRGSTRCSVRLEWRSKWTKAKWTRLPDSAAAGQPTSA